MNSEVFLSSHEPPDMLGADDFISIFDNIADFEKEIGIDGEMDSRNIQTIGMEQEQTDTIINHNQDNVNRNSMDSTRYKTQSPSPTAPHTRQNSFSSYTYWQHSRETTLSAPPTTENKTSRLPHADSKTRTPGHINGSMKTKNISRSSKADTKSIKQSLDINNYRRVLDHHIYQVQQKLKRQHKTQALINQRRQRFQKQQRMDDEHVPQQLYHIEQHTRANKKQRATERVVKQQKDAPFAVAAALALSDAISAAKSIGIPQLDNSTTAPQPQTQDRQHTHHEPTTAHMIDEAANTTTDDLDLDPDDPDPWDEEMRHYIIIGRIKRMEDLQARIEAEATGKEYKPTVYNPTGIQQHEFDPLLSRNGTGISVIGAALDAISRNTRSRPFGDQGSSVVLQDLLDAHTHSRCLDLQSLSKRQKISRTLGLVGNNNNNTTILDTTGADNGSAESNLMDSVSPSLTRCDKTSKLLISNLCNDVKASTLKSLATKGLKSLYLIQSNHTAIMYFLSIDDAVMFRRMYNRSLIGGQRITVNFMKN